LLNLSFRSSHTLLAFDAYTTLLTLQEKQPLRKGNLVPESQNLVPNSLLRREKAGRHPS